jgi:hypothetical protein
MEFKERGLTGKIWFYFVVFKRLRISKLATLWFYLDIAYISSLSFLTKMRLLRRLVDAACNQSCGVTYPERIVRIRRSCW